MAARKVLVCAIVGNPVHRTTICHALTSFYQVRAYDDPAQAIAEMSATPPAAILVDEEVEEWGGAATIHKIRKHTLLAGTPLICMTHAKGSAVFRDAARLANHAVLIRPFQRSTLLNSISQQVNKGVEARWQTFEPIQKATLTRTLTLFNGIADLIDEGRPLPYDDLVESCAPLVEAVTTKSFMDILKGIRNHDTYSYVHSLRVAIFLTVFGHAIGIRGRDLLMLAAGGMVHDIGKMSIPLEILNKSGRLSTDEWALMQSHVTLTADFLRLSPNMPHGVLVIAEQHHEKLDGTGYPKQLKGADLNELARMSAIVDIFTGLTDRRVYKAALTPEAALTRMAGMQGAMTRTS